MYIGIDLGGTNIATGIVDEDGNILHKLSIPTGASRHYTKIVETMANSAIMVCSEAGVDIGSITSIGVGSPGSCDFENGVLLYANNINFKNVPIRTEIQKYIDLPVFLENDANVAALAEYYTLGKQMKCFIAITLGTGVGGGIILDGHIYSGFNGAAGELGHMVITKDGHPCTCGRKGCWETYASATALVRLTREVMQQNPDSTMWQIANGDIGRVGGKTSFFAAKQGDKAGQQVVDQYLQYVSVGIANLINIFQPEMLVIGGGVSKEGDYLLDPIKKYIKNETYNSSGMETTKLGIATLGNDAGIVGAAFLGKA